MAIPKERFTSIKTEVIDVLSVLAESFDPDKDANLQIESHRQALGKYINCIARIGMAAGAIGFSGLRDACVIFQNHLRTLHGQNRLLTAQERDVIEEWPILVMSYLSGDDNSSSAEEIIRYLNNIIEEEIPDRDDFNDISQQLVYEQQSHLTDGASASGPTVETKVFVAEEMPFPEAASEGHNSQFTEPEIDASYHPNESHDSEFFPDIAEELHHAVQEICDELAETSRSDTVQNDRMMALQLYSDKLEIIGMSLSETGWLGITDCVFIYNEGVKELVHDEELQGRYSANNIVSPAELMARYIEHPGDPDVSIELISVLQSEDWIPEISDSEAHTLLEMLIPEQIDIGALTEDDIDAGSVNRTDENPVDETISQTPDADSGSMTLQKDKCDSAVLTIPEFLDKPAVELDENVVELLALVKIEIDSIRPHLEELIRQAFESDSENGLQDSLTDYVEQLDRFVLAADSVGLHGLSTAMEFLSQNVQLICDSKIISADVYASLHEWQEPVLNYLSDVNSIENVNSLLRYLASPVWPSPLTQEMVEELQRQLLSPVIEFEEEESAPKRPETVSDEDVTLQLPEDVNPDLLDSLLRELPGHTSSFSEVIAHLAEGNGEIADVERAQRIAHTLKGAANTVGVPGISNLTHHIEDILSVFTKHECLPGPRLSDSLMMAADTLESMSESLLGIGPAPSDVKPVLQDILNWANYVDENGVPSEDSEVPSVGDSHAEASSEHELAVNPGTQERNSVSSDSFLRVSTELVDELLRIVGEKIINNGRLLENLRKANDYNRAAQEHNNSLQQLVFELEKQVDLQGKGKSHQIGHFQSDKFDSLEMDQYNELHTITRQLVEAASDSQEFSFNIDSCLVEIEDLLIEQGRLSKQNRDSVMKTRMVPVNNIVPRLQRGVRQTARLTDKKVSLDITGQDTLVDGQVINSLVDPLMHILRNAIDHGIETYEERVSLGKKASGTISLSFFKEGDEVVVLCKDDGAGFDYAAIRDTAIKRDLLGPEESVTDSELHKFILHHGFSTRDNVTQVSGRGVGLDAVFNQIVDLKGSMSIDSIAGHGVSIELRLPVSFVSVHGIVARYQNQVVAFSSRGIEQILYPEAGVLSYENERAYYSLNDEQHDVLDIGEILGAGTGSAPGASENKPALLVRLDDGNNTIVLIDEVISSQELVIKPLGDYIPPVSGVEGATILGDGAVAAVIDLPDLIGSGIYKNNNDSELDESRAYASELTSALIVDDSLSARRSLSEFMQDMGYAISTARDGLEAIESIEADTPDIVLVDMEMPRMNGLELTSHIRANEKYKNIPIIMVTSRSTEKHRRQASSAGVDYYMVKPFSEEELLIQVERLLKENNAYAQPA